MVESRPDCFWGHSICISLFSPTDTGRYPPENITWEPLANRLLCAGISYLGKWVYSKRNLDRHTSWSPTPSLCPAWQSERDWLQVCAVKHSSLPTEFPEGSWTLPHGPDPFHSPWHASCLSVCPSMMLISLLIDFLALTILLSVSLEPVSKTHQYWLLRGFWST